jgi:hypothetical protein
MEMEKETSLAEYLHKQEEGLLQPEIRSSPKKLDKLLSDEFIEFGSSGHIWCKSDCIGEEGIREVKLAISNFKIRQLSENVVLTTYQTFNKESLELTLRSSIWIFKNKNWQMSFHQGTKVINETV